VERRLIDDDLETLKQRITVMGGLAEQRVSESVDALVRGDRAQLRSVIEGDKALNDLQMEIDGQCFRLLALQHPVAVDLRFVVAATKLTVDLERVGDLAVNIAETASRYLEHPPIKPLIDLPRMSRIAQQMLSTALHSFLTRSVPLAQSVLEWDDSLDELKSQVFRELLTFMLGDAQTIEPGTDLILIARHIERIGDHATNIAEDAIFIVEARDPRHGRPAVNGP
jgi:phosphate transport system protein